MSIPATRLNSSERVVFVYCSTLKSCKAEEARKCKIKSRPKRDCPGDSAKCPVLVLNLRKYAWLRALKGAVEREW